MKGRAGEKSEGQEWEILNVGGGIVCEGGKEPETFSGNKYDR